MLGESSRLSLTTCGSSTTAEFGGVSNPGGGKPPFDVTQSGGGPWSFVAVQPAGRSGGVTPSNASLNVVCGTAQEVLPASRISVAAVAVAPIFPPAATSLFPIAAPPIAERAVCIAGALAQVSVAGS